MPTPHRAFAAVAHALTDINPEDHEAVTMFYRKEFVEYPMVVRTLISAFLVGQTGEPSAVELKALKNAVAPPFEEISEVEAPAWDGPAMEYLPDDEQKAAAAFGDERPGQHVGAGGA